MKKIVCILCGEQEEIKNNKYLVIEIMRCEISDYHQDSVWGNDMCKKCLKKLKTFPFKKGGKNNG